MKALVMAGGFAKRLWPLTKEKPKALLQLNGRPLLEHVLKKIEPLEGIEQIYVSINRKFESAFTEFLKTYQSSKGIRLVVENSIDESQKLGSVGSIKYFMDSEGIEEPLLIIAGDNVLDSGLFGALLLYRQKKAPVVGLFDIHDRERAKNYGIVELDNNGRIASFEEKPSEPRSTLASTGIYILTAPSLQKVSNYLQENPGDRMGDFIKWLSQEEKVYGFVFQGKWFDIGSPEEYARAEREME